MSARIEDDPWVGTPTPSPKRFASRAVWWGLGACGVIAVLALVGGGALVYRLSKRPRTYAVDEAGVSEDIRVFLRARGWLEPGERLLYFYSGGTWDAESEGSFCTSQRVVDYRAAGRDRWTVNSVRYEELARVLRKERADTRRTVDLEIVPDVGAPFSFELPTRRGGDRMFEARLRAAWRPVRPAVAFASEGLWFPDGDVPADVLAFLTERSVLFEGENPVAFFGAVGVPLTCWGTFCTKTRVVVYSFEDGKEPVNWNLNLDDVESLEFRPGDPSRPGELGLYLHTRGEQEYRLGGDEGLLYLFRERLSDAARERRGK